jgi:hypothetical protein
MTLLNFYDPANQLNDASTDGLSGTADSISYLIGEIERHFHHYERWFETAAAPSGETNVADGIGSGGGAFQIDAGSDDWGSWVQVLGSADTPAISGSVYYDPHKIDIATVERALPYFIQIAAGTSGAAGLSAGTYTELVFVPQSVAGRPAPIPIGFRRQAVTTKLWARCKCPGQNTATLDFYIGIHEYEG